MRPALIVSAFVLVAAHAAEGRQSPPDEVSGILARVGARVVEWYGRAQSIVSHETVLISSLRPDIMTDGFPRRLQYELRIEWEPEDAAGALPDPTVVRQLLTVNGRPPRPGDDPGCMDPKPVTAEPLRMLLPDQHGDFVFSPAGTARVDGRAALVLAYRGATRPPPEITWTRDCVTVSLPGRSQGRIWIDAETYDVLRLDESLVGLFDFNVPVEHQRRGAAASMTIERADTSIRYRRVAFEEPAETLMLPAEVETLTIVRGGGIRRTRISQRFSDYRRFLTDARVLP